MELFGKLPQISGLGPIVNLVHTLAKHDPKHLANSSAKKSCKHSCLLQWVMILKCFQTTVLFFLVVATREKLERCK